uniref:MutL_C domain-containing protein n=1 Tax=Trichuris muris TaxID=70415 RepID=A0A5S6QWP0_TRIMR
MTTEQVESFHRIMSMTEAIEALLYNSLEAQSTSIVVQVYASKFKFQVIDNGDGLNADQAKNIALASPEQMITTLSAIIHVAAEATIESRQRDTALAFQLTINKKGIAQKLTTRDCQGTTVTIKGLFSMFPARQKGSVAEEELRKLIRTVQLIYIGNPGVAILLFDRQSGRPLFEAKESYSVDKAFQTVYGDIYRHELRQILYNNGKIVHDKDALQVVSKHVRKWRQAERKRRGKAELQSPVFIIFFNHQAAELGNVNCMLEDMFVTSSMSVAAASHNETANDQKNNLMDDLGAKVSLPVKGRSPTAALALPPNSSSREHAKSDPFVSIQLFGPLRHVPIETSRVGRTCKMDSAALTTSGRPFSDLVIDREMLRTTRAVAQFDRKFVLCKVVSPGNGGRPSKLLVFDQHAVSERILLERLLYDNVQQGKITKARLDESLSLPMQLLLPCQDLLRRYGVDWQESNGYAVVQTLPLCYLQRKTSRGTEEAFRFLRKLVDQVSKISLAPAPRTLVPVVRSAFNEWACKGAIKFGDQLNTQYCQYLIDQLASCQTPFCCAHGRRSFFQLCDFDQFEKRQSTEEAAPRVPSK